MYIVTTQIEVNLRLIMNNPHPIQTDDPDLNVEAIAPGKSITVILTKKGTFGFHNHLNPSDKAKITIQ